MKALKIFSVLFLAFALTMQVSAQRVLKHTAVLSFSATGGKALGTYTLNTIDKKSFRLPDNARITRAYYEVQTTFTSATDTATIAISIPTDDVAGIKAAIGISNVANPWDAGLHECIQTGTMATAAEKTTAATRSVQVTLTMEALTAGKLALVIEYVTLE